MKKIVKIIIPCFVLSAGVANAQEKEASDRGEYLNSNNILSSLAYEVADSVANKLNDREVKIVEKFKQQVNEKLAAEGLKQVIYFKTAGDNVNEKSLNYLNNLVMSLENFEKLNYVLEGYADSRGDAEYNLSLSLARIESIKRILLSMGVPSEKIQVINYGESKSSQKNNVEDYFYDRRVEIGITL